MIKKVSYCQIHDTYPYDDEPCWQCVNKYAPDAEALAVSLEAYVRECLRQDIKLGPITGNAQEVLSQYRARFPKAQETR